jgi:hypothetical protein
VVTTLRASTERTGDRGDGGWYEGVLRDGRKITWRCGHLHHNRDNSSPARPAARGCAAKELQRRAAAEAAFPATAEKLSLGGIAWHADGPGGDPWVIWWSPVTGAVAAWQPGAENRTGFQGKAEDIDSARREAARIASLIVATAVSGEV